jgi:membrane protein
LLRVSPEKLTVADIRRCFWQGNKKQQTQAAQVRRHTGLPETLLEGMAENPQVTVRQLLEVNDAKVD